MSSKLRGAAAVLIVSAMTCGSLSAISLEPRASLGDTGTFSLNAIVHWMAHVFSWGEPHGKLPKPPRSKVAVQVDPDGHH